MGEKHMYRIEWPNGDVSYALAQSEIEAVHYFDALDDPSFCKIEEVHWFYADFSPVRTKDGPDLRFNSGGECGDFCHDVDYVRERMRVRRRHNGGGAE